MLFLAVKNLVQEKTRLLISGGEPIANLDAKTGQDVTLLLCEPACRENRAVIIASHDQRLRIAAQRVITIEEGRLTTEDRGERDRHCHMHTAGSRHEDD